MTDPLTSTERLKVGMVVQIAVEMADKVTGQPYWWKRFAAVVEVKGLHHFDALTLKMHPDPEKDLRRIRAAGASSSDAHERREIVTILPEPWPQGVVAMHMKLVAKGVVKPGD